MSRSSIIDAAIKTLVRDNGASMQEIAVAADIGRATLHRYFPSRDDLIRAITELALSDAEAVLSVCDFADGPVIEVLEQVTLGLLPLGHRFHFLLNEPMLSQDEQFTERVNRLDQLFLSLFERGKNEGSFKNMPARWLLEAFSDLIYAAWRCTHDGYIASRDAPNLVLGTLLTGIGSSAAELSHQRQKEGK